ncbi:MAG: HIT family protein [Pseudonocardia sp.]|nr:HIT family protein [Pseudonocardia sp.]
MTTIFSRIIDGELPGQFVWSDDTCAAFLSINPLGPGHTLVVPRQEIDQWIDAEPELMAHLTEVAYAIGEAIRSVYAPPRVGLVVAGFEVPHLHVHVFPAVNMRSFDFANAAPGVEAAEQARHRDALRAALRVAGHAGTVPD